MANRCVKTEVDFHFILNMKGNNLTKPGAKELLGKKTLHK